MAVDDRFDRRELLLHLGDVLAAISCLAKAAQPAAPVAELANREDALQEFVFLKALAPTITAAQFSERAASAFFLWPKELLEEQLNRRALASTVQHDLFEGNPNGWKAYVTLLQKKVKWFGVDLPKMKRDLMPEAVRNASEEASPVESSSVPAESVAEWGPSDEKRGWPWPQPGSTS
ncbi:MAG: hypothetical protein ACRDRT_10940 [Pseudonocardiaceae bacterium]